MASRIESIGHGRKESNGVLATRNIEEVDEMTQSASLIEASEFHDMKKFIST